MLSVSEAQEIVLQHARPLAPESAVVGAEVLGRVLMEDVTSDLDLPPYDKAMMDGYALRCADLSAGQAALRVIEEIMAGRVPQKPVEAGQAARIMTGAPIPNGADAVIMIERTRMLDGDRVEVNDPSLSKGKNILPRATELRRGEVVLKTGTRLRPQEIGVLASVGRAKVQVLPVPKVAVLSTGDELVEIERVPGPGQIRNSNGPMLLAQVARAGGVPKSLGIAADRRDSLTRLIGEGLKADILVLSGGVSAGKLDLVPEVLQELGVAPHFHKVAMKPGKPVFFGTRPEGNRTALVFGLPGNPVSSLVCFELFVRLALRRLAGQAEPRPRRVEAKLRQDWEYKTDRETFHPVMLENTAEGWQVQPRPWFGSPDLKGVTATNAFMIIPAGEQRYRAGDRVTVMLVEHET
jgi:molybdopterin molybdotransferase